MEVHGAVGGVVLNDIRNGSHARMARADPHEPIHRRRGNPCRGRRVRLLLLWQSGGLDVLTDDIATKSDAAATAAGSIVTATTLIPNPTAAHTVADNTADKSNAADTAACRFHHQI